jgi:hypothetical protein
MIYLSENRYTFAHRNFSSILIDIDNTNRESGGKAGTPEKCYLNVTGAIVFKVIIEDNKEVVMTRGSESLVCLESTFLRVSPHLRRICLFPHFPHFPHFVPHFD